MNAAGRAVFFDRDGTLMEEVNYCRDPAMVRVYPGVPEALRKLRDAGFRIFIVTNQSGIAKGSNAPMSDEAAARADANAAKKKHKKAKVHDDTTIGTTTGTIAPETGTRSEQELKAKADIGSGTTPAAPTPANRASTVNDTQGQSGR